ncbi:MAG: ATP-dependent sacrificial sulfur transferase LarE [Anaerolineae bacterium]|nr:ATP-dependent sacrificial sulfur transferase LarE [Anaerolineae bacterium]
MTTEAIQKAEERLGQADLPAVVTEKWQRLIRILQSYPAAVTAYSGGVDSGFLAYAVYLVQGDRMLAVTVDSGLDAPEQGEFALQFAREIGFRLEKLALNAFDIPELIGNPPDRCYFCKKAILNLLWDYARQHGYSIVLEGQNMDDESDYRPGRRAVRESGTRSPLVESGLQKVEIRQLARALDLRIWNRPSSPCLATRFPYGTAITQKGLEQVAAGEAYLAQLGFPASRVRYYQDMARIETPPDRIEDLIAARVQVVAFFRSLGFNHIAVDLAGYRQGSMNEGLEK